MVNLAQRLAIIIVLAMITGGAARAEEQSAKTANEAGPACFFVNDMGEDLPLGDRSVLFRAKDDVFRLDFAQRCPSLAYPAPRSIVKPVSGHGLICSPVDLTVEVSAQTQGSIPDRCVPSALHRLTKAERAALPSSEVP